MRTQGERRSRGFTLIELLVVIAVITILAALVMPAVMRAVAASHNTKCQSNLHQVGAAFINYIQGYSGMMPSHDDEPGVACDVWGGRMYWRFAHGMLVPLMKEHGVFRCPSDPTVVKELGARKWFSYTWNTRVGTFSYSSMAFRHRNISECEFPSKSITFLDGNEGDGGTDGGDGGATPPGDRPYQPGGIERHRLGYTRHSGGFNPLFVDGHVTRYMLGETGDENYNW